MKKISGAPKRSEIFFKESTSQIGHFIQNQQSEKMTSTTSYDFLKIRAVNTATFRPADFVHD